MSKVLITTATKLTSAQLTQIKKAVSKKYPNAKAVESVVDPSIIGGIKVTVGTTQFDGSVVSKLNQVRTQLLEKYAVSAS